VQRTSKPTKRLPLFDQPSPIRIRYLGWARPILHSACDYLFEQYLRGHEWNLDRVLLVLPGSLAGRRLQILLAERAAREDVVLRPPEILTLGKLPERLYQAKLPFANELDQVMAWTKVLQSTPASELKPLLFEVPQVDELAPWMELARILGSLHRELASDLLDFSDVADSLTGTAEEPRWHVLATLQRRYLDVLHQASLWDVQTARQFALKHGEVQPSGHEIVLIGTVDLNRAQRQFLAAVGQQVTSLIGAPDTFSQGFDADGTLRSEFWQRLELPIDDDALHVRSTVRDAADELAVQLALLGSNRAPSQITVGVPDPTVIPAFQESLQRAGVHLRYGPGLPIQATQPMKLLGLIQRYLANGEIEAFHSLVRETTVEDWLRAKLELPDHYLASIDEYLNSTLLRSVNVAVFPEARRGRPEFEGVVTALRELLEPLRVGKQVLSRWAEPIRSVLRELYAGFSIDKETDEGHLVWRACEEINEAMQEWAHTPSNLDAELELRDAMAWLYQMLEGVQIPAPRGNQAIEMIGWLELALDDAPVLMLSGLHDGVIPESVNSDAFLPNRLRSELGLLDNARRYARDAYIMMTILHTREQIELILNRLSSDGDPLTPSRLLLSVPTEHLARRVLRLISDNEVVDAKVWTWTPRIGQSDIPIPQPKIEKPVADMAVTDFKKYSECPYRFYLNRVKQLRAVKHLPLELDGGAFGDLLHKVLEDFHEANEAKSSDPDAVCKWLLDQLKLESQKRFGLTPPPAVVVQLEQAEMRLKQFAKPQAEKIGQGWKMIEAEYKVEREHGIVFEVDGNRSIKLHGRIDRIDEHEDQKRWAVWDYKTGDSSGNPRTIHLKRSGEWTDWQLPLYGLLIKTRKGYTGKEVSFGYILLPRNVSETEFISADFNEKELAAAVQSARELAIKVVDGVFWPPIDSGRPEYDDYSAITQRTVVRRWTIDGKSESTQAPECQSPPVRIARERVAKPMPNLLSIEPVAVEGEPPPEWFQPQMIKASAGTGKTYRLASRAIHLLFSDQSLETVLATTFTRKAAGEILQRILGWLAKACVSELDFEHLERILAPLVITRDAVRYQLARLCSQLHRFRVSTLDSFYSQLARSFSLELELPPGWKLIDPVQEEQLRRDAITRMFEQVTHTELRSLISQLSKGEAVRSIRNEIDNVVKNGYEIYQQAKDKSIWTAIDIPAGPGDEAVNEAFKVASTSDLETESRNNRRDETLKKFTDQDWEEFLKDTLVVNCHSEKPSYNRKEIKGPFPAAVRILAKHAVTAFLASRITQNKAAYGLLEEFDKQLRNLKQQRRIVTFSDIARRLALWISKATGQEKSESESKPTLQSISHRLDCSIDHLLLDEFQDTSPQQWEVLKPFANAITQMLSDSPRSASFFVVGDTKQAIYAWRGGVSEIFESVGQEIANIQLENLSFSRRSSPIIIEFVNDFFHRLALHPKFLGEDDDPHATGTHPVIDAWVRKYFEAHTTAKENLAGYVEIRNAPVSKDSGSSDLKRDLMETIAQKVAEVYRDAPKATIGILTRTNDEVGELITLLRDRGIEASQEGGNPLVDTAAALVVQSAIQLANHPGDTLAHFHVVESPLGAYWSGEQRATSQGISRAIRREIDLMGLGVTVSNLVEYLAPSCNARDQERLKQLVEESYRFVSARGDDLQAFIEYLDSHRVSLPSESRVRVMTIHQAKGLEFDAVFLPSLHQNIASHPSPYLVMRATPTSPPSGIVRYMARELQRYLDIPWQCAFKEASYQQLGEALCLFYVALTRARQALYLFTVPLKNVGQNWGSAMHSLYGTEANRNVPDALIYQSGNPEWYRTNNDADSMEKTEDQTALATTSKLDEFDGEDEIAISTSEISAAAIRYYRISLSAPAKTQSIDIVAPSSLKDRDVGIESNEGSNLGSLWQADDKQGAVLGKLVHRWMEEIREWVEDGVPGKKRLAEIANADLTQDELSQIRIAEWSERFSKYLENTEIRRALSRSRYDDWHQPKLLRLEVSRERRLLEQFEGKLVRGSIDRCVLGYDGDRVIRGEVLDFKIDQYEASQNLEAWIAERIRVHTPQLQLYGGVLRQQYGLCPDQLELKLVLLSVGRVVSVPVIETDPPSDASPRTQIL
jgi:ATP-dependent exoDNAse (exonuclease V) beta subunit